MGSLRIEAARKLRGLSQQDLADLMGTSQAAVHRWETGARNPRVSTIKKISEACNVSMAFILGLTDNTTNNNDAVEASPSNGIPLPVFGMIAAGTPREALTQSDMTHDTPESLYIDHKNAFWLTVSGNSMNRLFPDGALVLIDPDEEVRNGDVAVVFVNGDDATLKRVYFDEGKVTLHPESFDPEYKDRVIDGNDPDAPDVRVIGKAVAYSSPDGWRP